MAGVYIFNDFRRSGKKWKTGRFFTSFYSFSPFSLWNPKTCLSSKGKNDFKRGGRVIFHTPDIVFDVLIFLIKMQECEFFRIILYPPQKKLFLMILGGKCHQKATVFILFDTIYSKIHIGLLRKNRIIKRGAGEKNYFSRNIYPCKSDLTYTS